MRRRVFTFLCALVGALPRDRGALGAELAMGCRAGGWALVICHASGSDGDRFIHKQDGSDESTRLVFRALHQAPPPWHPAFGFGTKQHFFPGNYYNFNYWWLSLPDWFLALLLAVLPGLWAFKMLPRSAKNAGRCTQCGYNLTGNTSGTCPECGTAGAAKA